MSFVGFGVESYHESMGSDLFDVFQFVALALLTEAQIAPDLSSGSPFQEPLLDAASH